MIAVLRAAQPTDAGATGMILHQALREGTESAEVYSVVEAIAFCGTMIDRGWVTVAVLNRRVVGFMALDQGEICALYLAETARGLGIGQQLLSQARQSHSALSLRAAQSNNAAQRFYQRHGFVEVSRSNGEGTDENLPDITYVWRKGECVA